MSAPRFEVLYDGDFLKDVRVLPGKLQDKLSELLEILRGDPFDARLHTKPLAAPLQGLFSFRITRDWRVGFKFNAPEVIQLLAAGIAPPPPRLLDRRRAARPASPPGSTLKPCRGSCRSASSKREQQRLAPVVGHAEIRRPDFLIWKNRATVRLWSEF